MKKRKEKFTDTAYHVRNRRIHVAWDRGVSYANTAKANKIQSSESMNEYAKEVWNELADVEVCESVVIVYLNRANNIIAWQRIGEGAIAASVADPRRAAIGALELLASACILIHNHPSGRILPSESDNNLTIKFKKSMSAVECQVLDHLIVTPEFKEYYSYADEGKI